MNRVSFFVSAAALLLPTGLLADHHEDERAPLTDVWFVAPKKGMEDQFEEAVTNHMAFRADVGDSRSWQAYTPVIGHKLNLYVFRACCIDWADQDAYSAENEEKGMSENWNANVHQYVDHYHHYFDSNDWKNSHWPDEGADGPYYGVTTWTRKPGAFGGAEAVREQLSQMALNDGWAERGRNWLWLERIGGEGKLIIVSPYASYADMAPPEQEFFAFVAEQLDSEEEAGALFSQFGAGFTDSDYTVWRHREELSMADDDE